MEVDSDNGLLGKLAAGGEIEPSAWPSLREEMIQQLDKIAHNEFPIPNLPAPIDLQNRLVSPLPSTPPSSGEADKENAPAANSSTAAAQQPPAAAAPLQHLEPGQLPIQINAMLTGIITHLQKFENYPPHTIQRIAELVLRPGKHYKALAPWLHAVDRVVGVTSGTDLYPLPPAIPDMAGLGINGESGTEGSDEADPAAAVAWGNPTNGAAAAAADEALGGALLTPIPWLNRPSPDSNNGDSVTSGGSSNGGEGRSGGDGNSSERGAQIHSESTETIDGPNGVGSIETVSVSVNGVPSTGHARGVTQGELLRQEQRAGVVPVSQLSRNQHNDEAVAAARAAAQEEARSGEEEEFEGEAEGRSEVVDGPAGEREGGEGGEDEDERPHARGPEEIGAGDIGPQSVSTSFVGEGGLEAGGIDVEAAVGRKSDAEEKKEGDGEEDKKEEEEEGDGVSKTEGEEVAAGTKRGPEEEEAGTVKKLKEAEGEEEEKNGGDAMDTDPAT